MPSFSSPPDRKNILSNLTPPLPPPPSPPRPPSLLKVLANGILHTSTRGIMGCTSSKLSGSLGGVSGLAAGGGDMVGELSPGESGGGDLRYNMLKANKGDRFHELFEVTTQLLLVLFEN